MPRFHRRPRQATDAPRPNCRPPILLLIALLSATRPALAGAPPVLNEGPMIRLAERSWNFGDAPQHKHLLHSFDFRNDGTAPLRIVKVKPDCGCTVAMPQDSILAPGASSSIKVDLNTEDTEGEQEKVVSVYTNDPGEPRIDLVLTCTTKPEIALSQRILDFGPVKRGTTPVLSMRLSAAKALGFRVLATNGGERWVQCTIAQIPSDTSDVFEISARVRPDAQLGRFNERIDLPMHNTGKGVEAIAVRGVVYSYFRLTEEKLSFIPVKIGKRYSLSTTIESNGDKPYKVTGAVSDSPDLKPSLKENGDGYIVTVTLEPQKEERRARGEIILKTTDPDEPELHLAVGIRVQS